MHGFYLSLPERLRRVRKHSFFLANLLIILLLLGLPYFLFNGKLFIGGDDTRLFYVYPKEYLLNTQFFSWTNLSSMGWNFSYQTFLPFVLVWTFLAEIIKEKFVLSYLAFSLPLVLGFIFFQKLIAELVVKNRNDYKIEALLGAVFFVTSPIIINNHYLNPLIPIWLIGLIPAICCYFLRFLKTGKYINVLKTIILAIIFSFGSHNIPWLSAFLMPMITSIILCSLLFKKKDIFIFIKRFVIFFVITLFSQSFWLLGFVMTFINHSSSSFTSTVVSKDFVSDFARSVSATSMGSIIYPLLNLYQRKIAIDFGWNLKDIYLTFYDKTYFLNAIYVIILFLGIFNFKKNTNIWERKIFIVLLLAFITSLFLFTINIGPLFDFYLWLGNIPGFVLFRNPYDKFALGYGFIYAVLITYCLIVVARKYKKTDKKRFIILTTFSFAIFINALPIKDTIVSPLWTTKNIYKNITIPEEYLDFMAKIKNTVTPSNNILSVPYGLSLYTVIKDDNSNNVYAGVSPVVIFSGVNDISGYLSFNYAPEGVLFDKAIVNRDYKTLNEILYSHNINYVFLTKNIPEEVKKSYMFVPEVLKGQDKIFLLNTTSKQILTSSKGNYELYKTKKSNLQVTSDNSFFKRINRVEYKILIKNVSHKQELLFNDSFHEGWRIYLQKDPGKFECATQVEINQLKTTECKPDFSIFKLSDLRFLWEKPIFESSHKVNNNFSNKWTLDPSFIKENFNKEFYKQNNDGSIDLELTLYFMPQGYFYIGVLITTLTVGSLALFVILKRK